MFFINILTYFFYNLHNLYDTLGFIACEEYSIDWQYSYPKLKVSQKSKEIIKRFDKVLGKDPIYGEKLYHEMLNFDVEPIHFEFNMPIYNSAREKQFMIMSWEAIRKNKSVREIIPDEEMDTIITELKEHQNDTNIFQSFGGVFQYIGKKR